MIAASVIAIQGWAFSSLDATSYLRVHNIATNSFSVGAYGLLPVKELIIPIRNGNQLVGWLVVHGLSTIFSRLSYFLPFYSAKWIT